MSVIIAPVFEKDIGDEGEFDDYVHGNTLAMRLEELDTFAQKHGVRPLGDFYCDDPAEIADLAGEEMELEGIGTPLKWFEAREGAKAVEGIISTLKTKAKSKKKWEEVLVALEALRNTLTYAAGKSIRFNIQAGS